MNLPPVIINFAFPGPADYQNGIMDNPTHFSCFSEGVPLGADLNKKLI
ncbi:MAG: hypothetical protein RR356_04445 [Bacteroidales bacterium]